MEKKWYAVTAKPGCELKAAAQLRRKKIDSFCPLNNLNNTGIIKRWNAPPLFPSIIFVNISTSEIPVVRKTSDVVNFLFWLGAPAIISDEEIKTLKRFTTDYSDLRIEKIPVDQFAPLQEPKTPFTTIQDANGAYKQTLVKIILPSLGYSVMASVSVATNTVFDLTSNARMRSVL
jgi:transcription termination/antitermination protein NusG